MSWSDEFEDPVPGRRTLQDAADHILKLSKAQQQSPHWQPAVEALVMAAEDRGPLLHARRDAAGDEPWQGTGVFRSQRDTLGQAEAEAGGVKALGIGRCPLQAARRTRSAGSKSRRVVLPLRKEGISINETFRDETSFSENGDEILVA